MKFILVILFNLIILLSCSPRKIAGTYIGEMNGGTYRLILDSSHRFNYTWEAHLQLKRTEGIWVSEKRDLYLTSDTSMTSINGRVEVVPVSDYVHQEIKLYFEDNKSVLPNTSVLINDSVVFISDAEGLIHTTLPLRSVRVDERDFHTQYHYYINKRGPMKLIIYLIPNSNSEIFFFREKYKVRHNLIFCRSGSKLKHMKIDSY